jgi:hypothetical protein
MKKTNSINKLAFGKATVTELNENTLLTVNGGSTIHGGETCTGCCCVDISIKVGQLTVIVPVAVEA